MSKKSKKPYTVATESSSFRLGNKYEANEDMNCEL